jgi:SP family general alpha glucoside:H+ symporter-like MFS transporter
MYIAEQAPNQLRGFLINAYSFWFVVGQLLAPVALDSLNRTHPEKYDVAIVSQQHTPECS